MRIESLTFLRFIAAILVVVFHYGRDTSLGGTLSNLVLFGPQMVTFFFVLSGFVLAIAYSNRSKYNLAQFYLARFARIAPVYIIALFMLVTWTYGSGNNNGTGLLLNVFFLQSWVPPYALSFNSPGWSLSVEMFFYITFPLLLILLKKLSLKSAFIFSLLFYILTQTILAQLLRGEFYQGWPSSSHDLIYYFPLSHYCSFVLGVCFGLIYLQVKFRFKEGFVSTIAILLSFILMYVSLTSASFFANLFGGNLAFGGSFYSIIFGLCVYIISISTSKVTEFLSRRELSILGEASYSVYIFQLPVYYCYNKLSSGYFSLGKDIDFLIYIMLLVSISVLVYKYVEIPARKLIMNLGGYGKSHLSRER